MRRRPAQTTQMTLHQTANGEYQPLFVQETTLARRIGSWLTYAIGWKILALSALAWAAFLVMTLLQMQATTSQIAQQLEENRQTSVSLETKLSEGEGEREALQSQVSSMQQQADNVQSEKWLLEEENGQLGMQVVELQKKIDAFEQFNETFVATVAEQLNRQKTQFSSFASIDALLAVNPTEEGPENARGTLFFGRDHNNEVQNNIVLAGLEPMPEDRVYQVWVAQETGELTSAGTISAGLTLESSRGTVVIAQVDLPLPADEVVFVGVSVEPAGGSERPSTPLLLTSS